MAKRRSDLIAGVVGASAGLAALVPSFTCFGGACTSCFACFGAGGAAAAALLARTIARRRTVAADAPSHPPSGQQVGSPSAAAPG